MLKQILKYKWPILVGLSIVGLTMPAQAQVYGDVTLGSGFSETEVSGVGGGSRSAKSVAGTESTATGDCVGYVDGQSDHSLILKKGFRSLTVTSVSSTDTTMVIKGPDGVWCNDDLRDKNAGITGDWKAGTYEVWVGSYGKSKSVPYTLKITTK
jgi:hypothetical protein